MSIRHAKTFLLGEGRHFADVGQRQAVRRVQPRINSPETQLCKLVELDLVAVVFAYIIEARKFRHQPVDQALAVVIKLWGTGLDEIVKVPVVAFREGFPHLAKVLTVEHGISILPANIFPFGRAGAEGTCRRDGNAIVHGSLRQPPSRRIGAKLTS
jgi:hypothetical protein